MCIRDRLSISPDAASSLSSYLKIVVNGTIYCPESLSSSLGNVEINGKLIAYPDKAILTKSVFLPNRYFHRTAKEGSLYYTPKLLVLLDSQLDLPALAEKQVRFSAQKVVLHDKDLETVLELLENPDTADLAILPDNGTYIMEDDAVLNDAFLQKYGPSFYTVSYTHLIKNSLDAEGHPAVVPLQRIGRNVRREAYQGIFFVRFSGKTVFYRCIYL